VVLGAGPTGLGAAHRLTQIGVGSVLLCDDAMEAGGLAASYVDENGFTWDVGGHVLFSHYHYFDRLMDDLLGDQWLAHDRESWVWMRERFIPYPLQNNIHLLPRDDFRRGLEGLLAVQNAAGRSLRHFGDWIDGSFGAGIAELFMRPYNSKVWACPPEEMSYQWVGERVARVDLMKIIGHARDGTHEQGWGPNNQFRFPLHGGTGQIWRTLASRLPEGVYRRGRRCVRMDAARRALHFDDGSCERYDRLISTIPLDVLVRLTDLEHLAEPASQLRFSTTHVVGVGLKGAPPPHLKTKCWMYFPEANCPFYRATVFSNYSPNNVPDVTRYWSLMVEVAESPVKPVERDRLLESVLEGLLATRLIESANDVASTWIHTAGHGYPTPFRGRDEVVHPLLAALEAASIFSRGRFGGWKYEVSNQDHSLMQGVELVNRLAFGTPEVTFWFPSVVNGRKS